MALHPWCRVHKAPALCSPIDGKHGELLNRFGAPIPPFCSSHTRVAPLILWFGIGRWRNKSLPTAPCEFFSLRDGKPRGHGILTQNRPIRDNFTKADFRGPTRTFAA